MSFFFSIVTVDWVPIVRDLVMLGMTTLNMTLSIFLSLTVIAFSWIRFRPLLGGTLLLCAALPFVINKIRITKLQ